MLKCKLYYTRGSTSFFAGKHIAMKQHCWLHDITAAHFFRESQPGDAEWVFNCSQRWLPENEVYYETLGGLRNYRVKVLLIKRLYKS